MFDMLVFSFASKCLAVRTFISGALRKQGKQIFAIMPARRNWGYEGRRIDR
jgi:hypothetical protein